MFSTCPTISVVPTSGSATTVYLDNPTAQASTISYTLTGDCPVGSTTLTIPAGASKAILIPRCVVSNVPQPLTYLNVYYKALNNSNILCPQGTNVNVTTDRLVVIATTGLPDLIYVNQAAITAADPIGLAVGSLVSQLTVLMSQIALLPAQTLVTMGIPVTSGYLVTFFSF